MNFNKNLNLKNLFFLVLHLFVFSTYSINAEEVNCKSKANLSQQDLNFCAFKERELSSKKLSLFINDKLFTNWEIVSKEICLEIWKKYDKGSIFPLLIANCQTKMNYYLLDSRINGLKGK